MAAIALTKFLLKQTRRNLRFRLHFERFTTKIVAAGRPKQHIAHVWAGHQADRPFHFKLWRVLPFGPPAHRMFPRAGAAITTPREVKRLLAGPNGWEEDHVTTKKQLEEHPMQS